MSRAGTKSNQGDDYQRMVALHWLIRLLDDEEIAYVQAESNGLPGIDEKVSVDDVVVAYKNGHNRYIQVKKNQPRHRAWSLSDLKDELPKIRDQLETNTNALVELYSRTPFGDLQSLAEASREYPDLPAFLRATGQNLQDTLTKLADDWQRPEKESLDLLRLLRFGPHNSFEEWRRFNKQELARLVPHVQAALPILESFLNAHQSKLQATTLTIRREDVIEHLRRTGLVLAPTWSEAEILQQFRQTSRIGRDWQRTVGGHKIRRPELDKLIQLVEAGANTVLVTDRPGSGKTCLLLDLADHIEKNTQFGLLFIKGDRFTKLRSDDDFKSTGLPEDIVGLCGRLSEYRQVVVIIDSLDVLSLSRKHGTLVVFLGLIDRLGSMQNVTVISACRSFDLQYDPLLRDRKWGHKISLVDFDFEGVVAPLLSEWGISETQIDEELKQLLRLPQNLRLFEAIALRSDSRTIRNVYELHEVYLDEVVRKNPALGDSAIIVLQQLADHLLRNRAQLIPLAAFSGEESVRRVLVSNAVLYQDSGGSLAFAHQTLFDTLVVYSSLAQGSDLVSFIKAHPPFPFLRPAVRTFVFHLRAHAPDLFARQIWQTLIEEGIAYHFKRLIVESLAEISPTSEDWPLIRRLFQKEPSLFLRLFWRMEGDAWFRLIVDHWLPSFGPPAVDNDWYTLLASHLSRWMNSHPEEVVRLWRRALSARWNDNDLTWRISIDLHKFNHWKTEGTPELIETLLQENKADRDIIGQVISRYIAATGQGDDLLWRYITKDMKGQDVQRRNLGDKLHCEPHQFHDEQFLKDRLVQSPKLLSMAVSSLENWGAPDSYHSSQHQLYSVFLHSSSWERCHSRNDIYPVDSLSVLLDGVEHAFIQHAIADDAWWQKYEPKLRCAREETLRYFLVKSYIANPETNVDGVGAVLTDKVLLRYGHLGHELGELIRASYHLLKPEMQETNQKVVLGLYEDEACGEKETSEWLLRISYEYLICIPVIFRLAESQTFIDRFQPRFGSYLPEPHIYSWGGSVGSPVPLARLLELSGMQLFRLLDYYNDYHENSTHTADHLKGGRNMVERVLGEAAALNPTRYLDLVPELERRNFQPGYLTSLLEGIANHLRYRFGRLQPPQDWQPVQPEPDGFILAKHLLNLIEECSVLWGYGHATVRMLEACCEVLDDRNSIERLVFLLYRLLKHPDPERDRQLIFGQGKEGITADDLRSKAINSVRGIAARSTIGLCNRLLEQGKEPPELLFPLLRHYARDPVQSVRAALLEGLPYLTYKHSHWGRQLFNDIFRETQTHLWPLAERYLYHQYHEHFDWISPFLHRMQVEAPKEAAATWGRIATLASISGHIEQDALFRQLESMNSISAWEGATQVFAANLDRHNKDRLCINGLRTILEMGGKTERLIGTVERAFDPKRHGRYLDEEFACCFIDAIQPHDKCPNLDEFFEWIAELASRDPVGALSVSEGLLRKLSDLENTPPIWRTEPLISALSSILREADETDDDSLIHRAVHLQDQFLRIDIRGIDEFFEQASRI